MPMVIMMQLITNKGGYMRIPKMPFSAKDLDIAIRAVPLIKDIFPKAKAGLNSLINEPEYNSKIVKLENNLHDKNADIFKLRQKIKRMKRLLFSNNEKIKDLEENLENCAYELNILNNAINNRGK